MNQSPKKSSPAYAGIVFSLALFLSGIFVLLTPVPLVYSLLKKKSRAFSEVCLPAIVILFLLYLFGLEPLYHFYKNYPHFSWLLPVPGIGLLDVVPLKAVIVFGMSYFLFYVFLSVLIAYGLLYSRKMTRTIGLGVLVICVIGIVSFVVYCLKRQFAPMEFLEGNYSLGLDSLVADASNNHMSIQQLAFIQGNKITIAKYLALFSPTMLFLGILFTIILNLVVSHRIFSAFFEQLRMIHLNQWTLDFKWVWLFIATLGILLINSFYIGNSTLVLVFGNILFTLHVIYFLQGLAILSFLLAKFRVPLFFRLLSYILLIFLIVSQIAAVIILIVIGLGFFDAWADFRKLNVPKSPNPD